MALAEERRDQAGWSVAPEFDCGVILTYPRTRDAYW